MKEKKSIDDALVELINTKIKEANITTVDRTTCMQTYALIVGRGDVKCKDQSHERIDELPSTVIL